MKLEPLVRLFEDISRRFEKLTKKNYFRRRAGVRIYSFYAGYLILYCSMLHELKGIGQEVGIQQITTSFAGDLLTLIAYKKDSLILCNGMLVEQDCLTLEQRIFIVYKLTIFHVVRK